VQPRETHRARFLRRAAKQKKKKNKQKTDPGKKTGKFMLAGALFRMEPKHNSLLLFQKFPTKFS
jgi:P pilus assembly chaperone PapD